MAPFFRLQALEARSSNAAPASVLGAVLFATLCLCSSLSQAQSVPRTNLIGFIKTVQAEATLLIDGNPTQALPGMPLHTGFVLKTGDSGSMGVTLQDNTMMSFGPNTVFVVDEYVFSPTQGNFKLLATLSKGTLQYISGVIAKLKPEAIQVKTPSGIIGVRGTRFLAKVDEADL